jgi:hypothetical protein
MTTNLGWSSDEHVRQNDEYAYIRQYDKLTMVILEMAD